MHNKDSYTEKAYKRLKHICDIRIYDRYKGNVPYQVVMGKIREESNKKNVDWTSIRGWVRDLGDSINDRIDEEDTILSALFDAWDYRAGEKAELLTDIFLENGFDVRANDGFNGASCLYALLWSIYDYRIIHIAKKLIDAGADCSYPIDPDDSERGILDSISFKCGYWNTGDFDEANTFSTYYELTERAIAGKEYGGIGPFEDTIGLTVTGVERLVPASTTLDEDEVGEGLVIWCGDQPLVMAKQIECMIDPYILEDSVREDVSGTYRDIIGLTVRKLYFKTASCAKLYFDGGKCLFFHNTYSRDPNAGKKTHCIMMKTRRRYEWPKGMRIARIWLESSITFSPHSTDISVGELYFDDGSRLFHLSGTHLRPENRHEHIVVDEIPRKWGCCLTRFVETDPVCIDDTLYRNGILIGISLKSGDSFMYVTPDHSMGISLIQTSVRLPHTDNGWWDDYGAQKKEIVLRDNKSFRNLRFLLAGHAVWNGLEIWPDGDNIRYKLEWLEDLDREKRTPQETHIEKTRCETSRMGKTEFLQGLDHIGIASWFCRDNKRASRRDEVVWWLFYDDGTGVLKERDHLDKPKISQEQMDLFVSFLESVVENDH